MGEVIRKGYADTRYGQVHVRMSGAREARAGAPMASLAPVVLLHQTASSSIMYERVMRALADDYVCIAPDTPGYGESFAPPQPPSIPLYAQALREALDALGVTTCYLFGHHTGASIAVQMASDDPGFVRRMILSGPPYLSPQQREAFKRTIYHVVPAYDGSHLLPLWQRILDKEPDIPLDLAHREFVLTLRAAEQYAAAYRAVFDHDLAAQLEKLTCPVHVMAGEFDPLRDCLEPAAAALRCGSAQFIPAAGTYVCERQHALVVQIIRSFFKEA